MRNVSQTPLFPWCTAPKTPGDKILWSPYLGPCSTTGQTSRSSFWTTSSRCPWNMPTRSSAANGARTGLLAMASVHSSQGHHRRPPKSLDPRWLSSVVKSCLPGLIKSGVSQPARAGSMPPEEGSGQALRLTLCGTGQLRKVIQRKLVAHKRQDQAKGLKFNLKFDHILELKEAQNNHCAAFNIELLWAYQPKDTQQFSADRLDNSVGHIRDNISLECNRERGAAALSAWEPHPEEAECLGAPPEVLPWQNYAVIHPASNTARARRAWSPSVHLKRPHRACSASTATFQLSWLVKEANAEPGFGASAREGQQDDQEHWMRAFVSQSWPWWHQSAFCQSTWSLHRSELRQPTLSTFHLKGASSPERIGVQRAALRRSGSDPLVPVDVNPTASNLCQQLAHRTHELAPRVNLKELWPPQGAPLVNPNQAIGDFCRSLASQGFSLLEAAGDVNDRESEAEGFPSYGVVWQKEQIPRWPASSIKHGPDLQISWLRPRGFDGRLSLPVASGAVVNASKLPLRRDPRDIPEGWSVSNRLQRPAQEASR